MLTEAAEVQRNDRRRSATRQFKRVTLATPISQVALLGFLCAGLLIRPATAAEPREAILSLLTQMEASYARIADYTAVFRKQERVDGKLLPEETTLLKFQKPLKVYMKWTEEPFKGTEALYVDGNNGNKLLVHRGGILGLLTLSLDPRGSLAMTGNRHPITEVGFGYLIEGLIDNIKTALEHGELEIIRLAEGPLRGRSAIVVEARFVPRPGRRYYTSRMICHIDKELLLPTGAAFYDDNDLLFERYTYSDARLNVGLTPEDFSRENKAYRF